MLFCWKTQVGFEGLTITQFHQQCEQIYPKTNQLDETIFLVSLFDWTLIQTFAEEGPLNFWVCLSWLETLWIFCVHCGNEADIFFVVKSFELMGMGAFTFREIFEANHFAISNNPQCFLFSLTYIVPGFEIPVYKDLSILLLVLEWYMQGYKFLCRKNIRCQFLEMTFKLIIKSPICTTL